MPWFLLRNKSKILLLIIVPAFLIILIFLGFNLYTSRFKNQELQSHLSKITRQLVSLQTPPSLPEGQREAMKQELINDDIPRLQKAREALRSGNTEEARRIIANEREILEFMSRTYLNLYPSLSLDANGNGMVDYYEEVYNQVIELEKMLSKQ